MKTVCKSVVKSRSFGDEVNGQLRYIVTVYINEARSDGKSKKGKLMRGNLTSLNDYQKSFALDQIYADEADYWEEKRGKKVFKSDDAFEDFVSEYVGTEFDDGDWALADIPLSEVSDYEAVKTSDGNVLKGFHFFDEPEVERADFVAQARRAFNRISEAGGFDFDAKETIAKE